MWERYPTAIQARFAQRVNHLHRIHGLGHVVHTQDVGAAFGGQHGPGYRSGNACVGVVAPGNLSEHGLARQPGQQRQAEFAKSPESVEYGQVVRQRLAEAEPRVQHQVAFGNAGLEAGRDALAEKSQQIFNNVPVLRVLLHRSRLALHVHDAYRHVQCGGSGQRLRVAQAVDVVDHRRAGRDRGAHDFAFHRVDGNRCLEFSANRLDDRHNALDFGFGAHRRGARSGRLAADVEDIRAFGSQPLRVFQRLVHAVEAPAVGKGIGCDVDDAHDQDPPGDGGILNRLGEVAGVFRHARFARSGPNHTAIFASSRRSKIPVRAVFYAGLVTITILE